MILVVASILYLALYVSALILAGSLILFSPKHVLSTTNTVILAVHSFLQTLSPILISLGFSGYPLGMGSLIEELAMSDPISAAFVNAVGFLLSDPIAVSAYVVVFFGLLIVGMLKRRSDVVMEAPLGWTWKNAIKTRLNRFNFFAESETTFDSSKTLTQKASQFEEDQSIKL